MLRAAAKRCASLACSRSSHSPATGKWGRHHQYHRVECQAAAAAYCDSTKACSWQYRSCHSTGCRSLSKPPTRPHCTPCLATHGQRHAAERRASLPPAAPAV